MKAAVIVFPGSNSDHDAFYTLNDVLGQPTEYVWHKDRRDLKDFDLVVLPGGFSYGDYLRTGAIARFAPVMQDVVEFAKFGGTVFGICNGFQILTECGLLPGALLRNRHLKFVGKKVAIRVENTDTRFTNTCAMHEVLINPIAHGDGNYFADAGTIGKLEDSGRVLFRYCTESGEITDEANPNGSINNIAGILNDKGNVAGMMPHPERCSDPLLGANDGIKIFHSLLESIAVES